MAASSLKKFRRTVRAGASDSWGQSTPYKSSYDGLPVGIKDTSDAYQLGFAHQLMKNASRDNPDITKALDAYEIYSNLGKGSTPYVINGVKKAFDAYRKVYSVTDEQKDKLREIILGTTPSLKRDSDAVRSLEMRRDLSTLINSGFGQRAIATASIIGLVGGIFFLSSNVTGNVTGLSTGSSSLIGVLLLVIGFVSGYFWVKGRKNSVKVISKKKNKED